MSAVSGNVNNQNKVQGERHIAARVDDRSPDRGREQIPAGSANSSAQRLLEGRRPATDSVLN